MKYAILAIFGLVMLLSVSVLAARKQKKIQNPLLREWTGPYGGVPPFDRVKVSDIKPALEEAMIEKRAQIETIVNNPATATFENTIEALELSGNKFERINAIYYTWSGSMSTPDFQSVEKEMAPKLAAFSDETIQNAKLYQRIRQVYESRDSAKLTDEQKRLAWLYETKFVLNGARLDENQKKRVAEINQRLATLETDFNQNLLADEEKFALILDRKEDLEGLPASAIESAAEEGANRKMTGKWVFGNTRSSIEPFLTYSSNRELREKAFRMWTSRGDNDNAHNNNKIVSEILKLRAERSKIFGYETYAHWHLADTMAKQPQAAMDLMLKVWQPAVAQAKSEIAEMQKIVDSEKGGFKIQPWDHRYYAEKLRKQKYDLDFNVVKPYLQLGNLRDAMFASAGKLLGFKFVQVKDVPVFHKSMSVYKVLDQSGKLIGLWYFDPYARAGKNSGAWMSAYREQYRLGKKEIKTLVSNNSNFVPGKPGEPILVSWDDAVTMFHEFGHALHGLSSNVTYASLSGTNTARDFVEFPSQINEHFLTTSEVLKFLKNAKGEVLPAELIAKIEKAKNFNQGFDTVEFLASAIVDMKLHLAGDRLIEPKSFEKTTLDELGMPKEIVMRHRIPQFGHVFSGEGYSAGYYGYLWAQVLEFDAYDAFSEAGNPYDQIVAAKLKRHIMSVGNTVDPSDAFRSFRGREPKVDALLRARGFPVPVDQATN